MPYLPTSQAFLEQSCLLLEAYPDTTRITTKYSFPSRRAIAKSQLKRSKSASKTKDTENEDTQSQEQQQQDQQQQRQQQQQPPIATLTLKTFNPASGICLKYRTNKVAEVGRLITSLGKLAGGASVADLGLSTGPSTTTASTGASAAAPAPVAAAVAASAASAADVEMIDAPSAAVEEGVPPSAAVAAATAATAGASSGAKGGKSKKKGGKGKR